MIGRALPGAGYDAQVRAGQGPALAGSIVLAELFYKFHSFTLECLAFLATWFVLDAALQGSRRKQTEEEALTSRSRG